jgi:hypothetical protein
MDMDVEEEQSKLSEERKRKARATDGDERFHKKSKAEEVLESKKFDVTEDDLGMNLVKILCDHFLTNNYRAISP